MERKKQMDSIEIMVARIDERVKIGFEANDECHNDIKSAQEKLCQHVNRENELLTARVNDIEMNGGKALNTAVAIITKAVDRLTVISEASVKRLDAIELDITKTKAERVGQKKVYQWAVGILSFALLVMGVAAALHLV